MPRRTHTATADGEVALLFAVVVGGQQTLLTLPCSSDAESFIRGMIPDRNEVHVDLSFSPAEEAFRLEVRDWIADAMPDDIREKALVGAGFSMPQIMVWHKLLHQRGWVAPHWKKAFGGAELDAAHTFILAEELELGGAPPTSPFGLVMVAPLIMQFGTDAQRERFLPKILSGEEVWCQGYSEPGAGSDLASLRCKAELDGDEFIVNGEKTWTTYAQYADWIFCLLRTDSSGKKQAGISFVLIDMKTPGVDVKPMLTLGGQPAFCDTYFENVRVPKENLLGPLHDGWRLAKALLLHERTLVGAVGPIRRQLRHAKRIAVEQGLDSDPHWRGRIAKLEMRVRAHQMANYRAVASQQAGKHPGPETSILKLVGSTLQQHADELCMDLLGPDALSYLNGTPSDAITERYCYNRATTIYAGSNEIQRNIIARWVLGLPKGA